MPSLPLTDEQLPIATAGAEERLLVTAGPGTGKTHVLIARLVELVEEQHLSPADELLVLSFSRAAVGEVRRRVKDAGGAISYGTAMTFDSFATRLLGQVDPGGSWTQLDYDGRIERAIQALREDEDAAALITGYAHIIVDELQDLVGVRADLVRTILELAPGGFTLFGDPGQGIYNFQLDGPERSVGALLLFEWLRRHFREELREITLSKNFRVQSSEAQVALWAGPALNAHSPDYAGIKQRLEQVVDGLARVELDTITSMLAPGFDGLSTAILSRFNGQALIISGELFTNGIPHRYQRSATDRAVAPWVGRLLSGFPAGRVGRGRILAALDALDGDVPAPEEAWRMLRRIDGRHADDLDVSRLQARIRIGDVPDEITQLPLSPLVVSTIHRAKGLEFDRVVLVDPGEITDDWLEMPEEVRLLYVALTRAKAELLRMDSPNTWGLSSKRNPFERWVRRGTPPKQWMIRQVEICGRDSFHQDPAGGFAIKVHAVETQKYIAEVVQAGDPVTLVRVASSDSGEPRVYYTIEHEGRQVGVADVGVLLFQLLNRNGWVRWPDRIDGLFVECVDTVAGTSPAGERVGLGSSGIWLRVRAFGLGRLIWTREEPDGA
jgi:hypothetical protein